MNSLNLAHPPNDNSVNGREVEIRGVIKSGEPRVLTNIYREDTNIVVWQRKLSGTLRQAVEGFLKVDKVKRHLFLEFKALIYDVA